MQNLIQLGGVRVSVEERSAGGSFVTVDIDLNHNDTVSVKFKDEFGQDETSKVARERLVSRAKSTLAALVTTMT